MISSASCILSQFHCCHIIYAIDITKFINHYHLPVCALCLLKKASPVWEKKICHKPWASLLSCSTYQEFQDLWTFHHMHFSNYLCWPIMKDGYCLPSTEMFPFPSTIHYICKSLQWFIVFPLKDFEQYRRIGKVTIWLGLLKLCTFPRFACLPDWSFGETSSELTFLRLKRIVCMCKNLGQSNTCLIR